MNYFRPQAKGLSLPFYTGGAGHPEHPGFDNNISRITTAFRCDWVKYWISWPDVQPADPGGDFGTFCASLNGSPAIRNLDYAIKMANDVGVYVLLTVDSFFPLWASFPEETPHNEPVTGKSPYRRFPRDLETNSPWGKFVSYLYNRYRFYDAPNYRGKVNPNGPNPSDWHGNPMGAWIGGFEPMNELNYGPWPQDAPSCVIAKMMHSVETIVTFWNGEAGQQAGGWFAPALQQQDGDSWRNSGSTSVRFSTASADVEDSVLDILSNWRPRCYVGWSTHNYKDVRDNGIARTYSALDRLERRNWRGGGDRDIWITEGGFEQNPLGAQLSEQAAAIRNNWANLANLPPVALWTQHLIHNKPFNSFTSGLKYVSANGVSGPDNQWPAYAEYARL